MEDCGNDKKNKPCKSSKSVGYTDIPTSAKLTKGLK